MRFFRKMKLMLTYAHKYITSPATVGYQNERKSGGNVMKKTKIQFEVVTSRYPLITVTFFDEPVSITFLR